MTSWTLSKIVFIDIRTAELVIGRSINLALSVRGRTALREVGLEDKMLKHGIPMYGRMIHNIDGTRNIIPYDRRSNQAIYSVGRKYLNEILLTGMYVCISAFCGWLDVMQYRRLSSNDVLYHISATEKYPNINLKFNKKMSGGKVEKGEVQFVE